jgi:hypothetical protein
LFSNKPSLLAVGYFNGDGALDLVVGNEDSVSVLINSTRRTGSD